MYNVHIHLILIMSVYQLLYDLSIHFGYDIQFSPGWCFGAFVSMIGGIGASIISNLIILNIFSLLLRKKFILYKMDWREQLFVHSIALIPGVICIALDYSAFLSGTLNIPLLIMTSSCYYAIRGLSILINIVFFFGVQYLISHRIPNRNAVAGSDIAIISLVERLRVYPLVQFLTRFLPTWSGLSVLYQKTPNSLWLDDDDGGVQVVGFWLWTLMVISEAMTSVGYLIAFLWTQPVVVRFLRRRLTTCQRSHVRLATQEDSQRNIAAHEQRMISRSEHNTSFAVDLINKRNAIFNTMDSKLVGTIDDGFYIDDESVASSVYGDGDSFNAVRVPRETEIDVDYDSNVVFGMSRASLASAVSLSSNPSIGDRSRPSSIEMTAPTNARIQM